MIMIRFDDVFMIVMIGSFLLFWMVFYILNPLRAVQIAPKHRLSVIIFVVLTILLFFIPAFREQGVAVYTNDEFYQINNTIKLGDAYAGFGTSMLFILSYIAMIYIFLRIFLTQIVGTKSLYSLEFVSIFHSINIIRYITYFYEPITYGSQFGGFTDAVLPTFTLSYQPLLGFYVYIASTVILWTITVATLLQQSRIPGTAKYMTQKETDDDLAKAI